MPLFDTHAHYNDNAFHRDREALLDTLPGAGVGAVVIPGVDVESARSALALAETRPWLFAAAGLHRGPVIPSVLGERIDHPAALRLLRVDHQPERRFRCRQMPDGRAVDVVAPVCRCRQKSAPAPAAVGALLQGAAGAAVADGPDAEERLPIRHQHGGRMALIGCSAIGNDGLHLRMT